MATVVATVRNRVFWWVEIIVAQPQPAWGRPPKWSASFDRRLIPGVELISGRLVVAALAREGPRASYYHLTLLTSRRVAKARSSRAARRSSYLCGAAYYRHNWKLIISLSWFRLMWSHILDWLPLVRCRCADTAYGDGIKMPPGLTSIRVRPIRRRPSLCSIEMSTWMVLV